MSEIIHLNVPELQTAIYGDTPVHNSSWNLERNFVTLHELSSVVGENVWIRGYIHRVRARGKQAFIVLRSGVHTVQLCAFVDDSTPRELIKYLGKIPTESICDFYVNVNNVERPIESCSISSIECLIKRCLVISRADVTPFSVDDAMRPETDDFVSVNNDTRMNARYIDLRVPTNQAILKVNAVVCSLFREVLTNKGFTEIQSPKIQGGASEGGSEVFKFDYFGSPACLAQSPQIYKQMAIVGGMQRVFEVGPVFRAENSNTNRHLCEFVGFDFEMEIYDSYRECLKVLSEMFIHIFKGVKEQCKNEIEIIKRQFPFEDLVFPETFDDVVVITFKEGCDLLMADGHEQDPYSDITTDNEKALGDIIKRKYNTDFYILDKFPMGARPFYTMPDANDDRYSNSYDVFIRGQEVTSGAQRIHDYNLLCEKCIEKGVPVESLGAYAESFKYGCAPHAGAGIGAARVVSLILDLQSVKKACFMVRDPKRLSP